MSNWGLANASRVPSAPFAEWLNERAAFYEQRNDLYRKWRKDLPAENSALKDVCWEVGWRPNLDAEPGREWDAALRRLYRFRNQLGDAHRSDGCKKSHPVDVYKRKVVEEALFAAGVSFRDLYESYADRLAGTSGNPRDILRFIDIWLPLVELFARDDAPLERDAWCEECREMVTPLRGRCPWHMHQSRLVRAA